MFRSSAAAALAALLLGCATRPPAPAELSPLDPGRAPRAALPDELERAAGRALALAYADRTDHAALAVGLMRDAETARRAQGHAPSGLPDWAAEAVAAAGGTREYRAWAESQLERDDLDPLLRTRMERQLARHPLVAAERSLAEERSFRRASRFNRIASPLTRLALGGGLNPIETGQAALRSLLLANHFPPGSARERRALRAYRDFLARQPDAPEAGAVRAQAERLERELGRARADAALEGAREALAQQRFRSALGLLARAELAAPGDPEIAALRGTARAGLEARDAALRRALSAERESVGAADARRADLAAAALGAPPDALARLPREATAAGAIGAPEQRFLEALALRGPGEDEAFFAALEASAELPGPNPMARHATRVLRDPEQNPYRAYRRARSAQRAALGRWLLLGSLAKGPPERGLPRPAEYLLGSLSLPFVLLTTPLRVIQLPAALRAASPPILRAGERYLARFPEGAHAPELRAALETRSASLGLYNRALEHNRARGGSARRAARYREQLAEALLEGAERERRPEMRVAIYAELLSRYADTHAARSARSELAALLETSAAQQIRLSRAFLREHPALLAPDALALRAELLDGAEANGELGEAGVTLLGGAWVRIALEEREPALERVPAANLARLAALLDETRYRALAGDAREPIAPDPQRDAFLERARLGMLDPGGPTASARSQAEYLSTQERHGWVRGRDSILPFEVVVQGDLETLGLGAAPRLRLPAPDPDAFLYE